MTLLIDWVAFGFGIGTFALSLIDVYWFHLYPTFLPSIGKHCRGLILMPGLFALSNGVGAVLHRSAIFYTDVAVLCRLVWVYHYVLLLTSYANILGYGGEEENIIVAGKYFDGAGRLKPQLMLPPLMPFACALTFVPSTAWLRVCIRRTKDYIWLLGLLLVLHETLQAYGLLREQGDTDLCPKATPLYGHLAYASLLCTFYGLSGIIPLVQVMNKLVLPERAGIVSLRFRLYIFFVPAMSVQDVLFSAFLPRRVGPCTAEHMTTMIFALEMFVFQLFCHKAFVPLFTWQFPAPKPPGMDFVKTYLETYKIIRTPEEMVRILNRDKPEEASIRDAPAADAPLADP